MDHTHSAPTERSGLTQRVVSISGSRLVCGWWVTGLVGFTLSARLPDPFGSALAGVTGLVLFASWTGYPLILVFATPSASPTRAVRLTAVATALTLVACLVIGSRVDSIALSLAGFAAVVFLCTIGAHVLGTAEHRWGLYRPLHSFFAVLATLYWPIGGIYVHNRLRRVIAASCQLPPKDL